MPFETALPQWEEGERRLRAAAPELRTVAERVTERIVAELRRRLGGPFTTEELAALYDRGGTGWCTDTAALVAPEHPEAWDATLVGDAAFHRYLREASDYAGGRRRLPQEDAAQG